MGEPEKGALESPGRCVTHRSCFIVQQRLDVRVGGRNGWDMKAVVQFTGGTL